MDTGVAADSGEVEVDEGEDGEAGEEDFKYSTQLLKEFKLPLCHAKVTSICNSCSGKTPIFFRKPVSARVAV